jgi:hypothetical protein
MIFGRNTNLKHGNVTFHIQTEDRGESHALIDTSVYYQGRVLHRRANNYFDLLPLDEDRQQALKLRLDEQHRSLIEEIRSGVLQLSIPAATVPPPANVAGPPPHADVPNHGDDPKSLSLELTNSKSWLSGKHAKLLLHVSEQNGEAAFGARLKVQIEGSDNVAPFRSQTDEQGNAEIEFDMPRITSPVAALVIHAEGPSGKGSLRFALRAKPRVA